MQQISDHFGFSGTNVVSKLIHAAIAKAPRLAIEDARALLEDRSQARVRTIVELKTRLKTSKTRDLETVSEIRALTETGRREDEFVAKLRGLFAPVSIKFDVSKLTNEELRALVPGASAAIKGSSAQGDPEAISEGNAPPLEGGESENEGT